jgi:hypothetical protein
MDKTEKPLIYESMQRVMAEVGAIEKLKQNKEQGFRFRGIDDVYNALHLAMAKHGVFTTSEVVAIYDAERTTKSGSVMMARRVHLRYTFWAPDGSFVLSEGIGEAMDTGDKATNKCFSAAHKYVLLQAFCIGTEDIAEADAESPEAVAPKPPAKPEAPKEKLFSEELKDAFEAGQITAAEREDLHSRAAKTNTAAIAVGGKPDFSALRAELARKTGPKAPAKAEEPDIY